MEDGEGSKVGWRMVKGARLDGGWLREQGWMEDGKRSKVG